MTESTKKSLSARLGRVRNRYPSALVFADLLAFVPGFWFAGLLRNEVAAVDIRWSRVIAVAAITAIVFVIIGYVAHLYRNRFRVATFEEVLVLGGVWAVAAGAGLIANLVLLSPRVPTSIFGLGVMIAGSFMIIARVVWRLLRRAEARPDVEGRTRVLVFGAGEGGTQAVSYTHLTLPTTPYV